MAEIERFRIVDALFIIGSIITFIADQATDVILAVTFGLDGLWLYSGVTIALVLIPNIIVQIFSARWNKIDETLTGPVKLMHGCLLGTLHRYYMVLKTGLEARQSNDPVDYQRYYQQWSDICMLRLFDSFMESGPQLVFQLVLLISTGSWPVLSTAWISLSAVASTVSLGWGVAAYSQALRLVRADKGTLSWPGMLLQTTWRFFMISARVVALVLLCLALSQWALIVIFVHWLLMTAWVVWQATDFCTNVWEERLYNGVVGIIYCFCFFNLKEGRSRYRMAVFYTVTFVENLTFVAAYYWSTHHSPSLPVTWFSLGAMVIVVAGTAIGLCSMVLYYRFYHPAGPIIPGTKDILGDNVSGEKGGDFVIKDSTYVEEKETSAAAGEMLVTMKPKTNLKPSRSFKQTIRKPPAPPPPQSSPPRTRVNSARLATPLTSPLVLGHTIGVTNSSPTSHSPSSPATDDCKTSEKMDSAYGTDSNRTASRNTETSAQGVFVAAGKSPTESYHANQHQNVSAGSYDPNTSHGSNKSSSSAAFNNETYMSIENSPGGPGDQSYMSVSGPIVTPVHSNNNTYQSVHPLSDSGRSDANTSQDSQSSRLTVIDQSAVTPKRPRKDLLKRSPVVKDVTNIPPDASSTPSSKPGPDKTKERLHAPLTIIIPNISHQAFTKPSSQSPDKWSDKTISLDILNPGQGPDISNLTSHDYENLALVNINRMPLGPTHWRTYSDMANSRHDDSTKYEKSKLNFTSSSEYSNYSNLAFCDVYPLTRAMREQLYRSLTPVSTAATMASSPERTSIASDLNSNHTYEPIETASQMFSASGDYGTGSSTDIPVTLIHHDGRRVTANKITNIDTLRNTLSAHEQIPYDDPENRGDLYILAPMRLLTPIIEESDTELTRNKIYQELSVMSRSTQGDRNYSDVDASIMSIISEVLSVRNPGNQSSMNLEATTNRSDLRILTAGENIVDTNCLLSTIEEIRNNSMCNLYSTSFNDPHRNLEKELISTVVPAPRVPPRHTAGYQSLCKENGKSKGRNEQQDLVDSFRAIQDQRTVVSPEEKAEGDPNESIKSINSNTLVVTPSTVKPAGISTAKRKIPLQTTRGCRKNILDLVTNTKDILNTPKRVKVSEPPPQLSVAMPGDNSVLSESMVSENNEFKVLMPHLTYTGAKFLNKVTRTEEVDLEGSITKQPKLTASAVNASVKERLSFASPSSSNSSKLSVFTNTPSPVTFVRNVGNTKRPNRKLSIVRERVVEDKDEDNNSDYKYGFMKEHPDAKYGFGYFPTDSYNVLETAKLARDSYRGAPFSSASMTPVIDHLQASLETLTRINPAPAGPNHLGLSALNRGDTAFKLHPDETYENLTRNHWGSASLQRHRDPPRPAFSDRDTLTRRSMSILDDLNDEKENNIPRQSRVRTTNRAPLGSNNSSTSLQNNVQPVNNFKLKPSVPSNNNSHFVPIRKTSVS